MQKKLLFSSILYLLFSNVVYAEKFASCGNYKGIPYAIPAVIRSFIFFIKIIVPIFLIVFIAYDIYKFVISKDPDSDKLKRKIIPKLVAVVSIFMVVTMVQVLFKIIGTSSMSECVNCFINDNNICEYYDKNLKKDYSEEIKKASEDRENVSSKRQEAEEKNRQKTEEVWNNRGDYCPTKLDLTCTSSKVKSQFSCDTLSIVENHLYDFNSFNFRSIIASYGGFDKYAKSLGGVFSEYYGKELHVTTVSEFQKVAEYTFGWMYMFGMDYYNSGGEYQNWGVGLGQSGHSDDAFYTGNNRAGHWSNYFDQNFDEIISGTGVNQNLWMATECGPAAQAPLYKAGILKKGAKNTAIAYPTRFQDLRPGDIIHFFDSPRDKTNRGSWGQGQHVALIGEVYKDKIIVYDGGRHYQTTRNYKREIKMVFTDSEEYAEIKRVFGFDGWTSERFADLDC